MVIISVDGNELEKITVEDTSSDQLNVIGRRVVGVDRTEAIRLLLEFANGVAWHRRVAEVENQRSFGTQIL